MRRPKPGNCRAEVLCGRPSEIDIYWLIITHYPEIRDALFSNHENNLLHEQSATCITHLIYLFWQHGLLDTQIYNKETDSLCHQFLMAYKENPGFLTQYTQLLNRLADYNALNYYYLQRVHAQTQQACSIFSVLIQSLHAKGLLTEKNFDTYFTTTHQHNQMLCEIFIFLSKIYGPFDIQPTKLWQEIFTLAKTSVGALKTIYIIFQKLLGYNDLTEERIEKYLRDLSSITKLSSSNERAQEFEKLILEVIELRYLNQSPNVIALLKANQPAVELICKSGFSLYCFTLFHLAFLGGSSDQTKLSNARKLLKNYYSEHAVLFSTLLQCNVPESEVLGYVIPYVFMPDSIEVITLILDIARYYKRCGESSTLSEQELAEFLLALLHPETFSAVQEIIMVLNNKDALTDDITIQEIAETLEEAANNAPNQPLFTTLSTALKRYCQTANTATSAEVPIPPDDGSFLSLSIANF